ncbi:MAG: hypothetical protein GY947_21725 [Rhodobacteraceae bacterium]|nr:hypothetical protein [Paracoccaceae bacterium]
MLAHPFKNWTFAVLFGFFLITIFQYVYTEMAVAGGNHLDDDDKVDPESLREELERCIDKLEKIEESIWALEDGIEKLEDSTDENSEAALAKKRKQLRSLKRTERTTNRRCNRIERKLED